MLTVARASAEPRAYTLERFGLTEEARLALATHWGDRLAKDPNLKSVFDEHVRKHRGR